MFNVRTFQGDNRAVFHPSLAYRDESPGPFFPTAPERLNEQFKTLFATDGPGST
jgi:hypothetical protein